MRTRPVAPLNPPRPPFFKGGGVALAFLFPPLKKGGEGGFASWIQG